jgi:hypothetical protein
MMSFDVIFDVTNRANRFIAMNLTAFVSHRPSSGGSALFRGPIALRPVFDGGAKPLHLLPRRFGLDG